MHAGAGAGYYTAIPAELVGPSGRVVGFEIDESLASRAQSNLAPWPWAAVEPRSGLTIPEGLVDLIHVNAGVQQFPTCRDCAAWRLGPREPIISRVRRWLLALILCAPATVQAGTVVSVVASDAAKQLDFAPEQVRLSGTGRHALLSVANVMYTSRALRLSIVGHGAPELAKRRAEAVKWFLVDNGVETDRITTRVDAAPGAPIELRFQPAAARLAATASVTATHRAPVVHTEPAARRKRAVRARREPASPSRVAPDPASDVTSMVGLFADATTHRADAIDLDAELARARQTPISIGSTARGFRDSATPQLPAHPLALSFAPVVIAPPAMSNLVDQNEPIARVHYRVGDAPDAALRARIRAQRRAR